MTPILFTLSHLFATATLKCVNANGGKDVVYGECDTGLPTPAASSHQLQTFLHIALGIFAVIAVLMIVISAMNIVYAEGDSEKVNKARGSIIYALVGLIIAIIAEVFVSLILGRF